LVKGEGVPMERHEAVAVLKEIINGNLGMPSIVALERNKHGKFDLKLKGDCDIQGLREFVAGRNLALKEDEEKGYCSIIKP
jgi:hypothetical protein